MRELECSNCGSGVDSLLRGMCFPCYVVEVYGMDEIIRRKKLGEDRDMSASDVIYHCLKKEWETGDM